MNIYEFKDGKIIREHGLPDMFSLLMQLGVFLFAYDCHYQLPGTTIIAVLAEVDALPSAKIQTAIGDGDGDADTTQCRFCMSRHIVSTFQGVLILWTILRNQSVEDGFHIDANIRVAVLVDAQSATGMFREDGHDARLRQFRQLTHYLARHQMEASVFRLQDYLYLLRSTYGRLLPTGRKNFSLSTMNLRCVPSPSKVIPDVPSPTRSLSPE